MFWKIHLFNAPGDCMAKPREGLRLPAWITGRARTHQNRLHPDEMSDGLKRDLGLLDGRAPRGRPPQPGSSEVLRLIERQRSL